MFEHNDQIKNVNQKKLEATCPVSVSPFPSVSKLVDHCY